MAIQVPALMAAARAASMTPRALPSRAQKIAEKVLNKAPKPIPQRPGLMGMLPPPPPPHLLHQCSESALGARIRCACASNLPPAYPGPECVVPVQRF